MLLAFPVLGLRQPPAQERFFLCVRGGRVANAGAHLLECDDFSVRPEALVGGTRWLSVLWSPVVRCLSFACGHDRACGQQPCLQHHGRLLSNSRNSDDPLLYIGIKGVGGFLFCTLGRHSNHPTSLSSGASLTRHTQLHVFQTHRTIWPSLHQVPCSTQSFRNRAHQ